MTPWSMPTEDTEEAAVKRKRIAAVLANGPEEEMG
jgi:hypothetical protein